jgi:hypothetical protein
MDFKIKNYFEDKIIKEIWLDPGTYTTTLLVLFLDNYGTEGLGWAPETIQIELEEYITDEIPEKNMAKLMTGISLLTTNKFYRSLPDFNIFCGIMSNKGFDKNILYLSNLEDISWGLFESFLIAPPENFVEKNDKKKNIKDYFDPEIIAFIQETIKKDDYVILPKTIQVLFENSNFLINKIKEDFIDDPELFSLIYKMSIMKSIDIDNLVIKRLRGLLSQIKDLPLKSVSTSNLKNFITRFMSQLPPEEGVFSAR